MAERLLEQLCSRAALSPERIIARSSTRSFSNADFLNQVRAWSDAFERAPGASFALYLEDSFEFAAALFGAWQAAKTLWLPGDLLPSTVARLAERVHGFAGELPVIETLPHLGLPGSPAAAQRELIDLDPERCQLMLFTSGSSGEATAVGKCLRQLQSELIALQALFGASLDRAVVHSTVSHQHIYGLLFRLLWPLSCGRVFSTRRLEYPEEIAAISDRAVILVASPAHLKRLPDTLDWHALGGALRAIFSSGGPLPIEAAQLSLRLLQCAPIEVFGSTETGGIAWRQYASACGAWTALPGVDWQIEHGLLQVRSAHLPEPQWYLTEDRAVATLDGGFELLGRADRIFKLEERRISLSAIEQRLLASTLLDEAKVLVLPGARALLAAVGVLSAEGQRLLEQQDKRALVVQLRDWLRDHVDPIAIPKRWRFVDALPVDAQGKSSQQRLAQLFRPMMPGPNWLRRDSHCAQLELLVESDLALFDGHFPGTPVLPGVAMLDWALQLAQQAFGVDTTCLQIDVLKFQHIVRPGTLLQVELGWKTDTATLSFSFISTDHRHASGRFRLSPGAAA